MFTIRARIFAVVSLLALFVLGVSLFLVVSSKKKTTAPGALGQSAVPPAGGTTNYGLQSPPPLGITARPQTAEEVERQAARQLAKTFVERYGSYSTHNDYANIKAVEELVTPAFWQTLGQRMTKPQAKEFYGVTTMAVSAEIIEWQDGQRAKVSVKTRRLEEKSGERTLSDFSATMVALVKEGDRWLVDKIEAVK